MNKTSEWWFDRCYWLLALVMLLVVTIRSITVPFAHDEVATFIFYIQQEEFWPFLSHPDANGHFLMSASGWLSFKIFGSQPWALRLPCILSFVVMVVALFKLNKLFSGWATRVLLTSAFLLCFNFLSFYSLCRGYGISMAFLLFGLYYFFTYQRYFNFRHFLKFVLFTQIALAANLTLLPVLGLCTLILVFFQIRKKLFFTGRNIALLVAHGALLLFWAEFGLFLKEQGALYYGGGESYWVVTFKSLMDMMFFPSSLVYYCVFALFIGLFVFLGWILLKRRWKDPSYSFFLVSFITLLGLIVTFWILKRFFGVNYPEDRTGLFFYLFFVLTLCFLLNNISHKWQWLSAPLVVVFVFQFLTHLNFRIHPWRIYETMPKAFFEILKNEQKKTSYPITIAGHRVREFIYGFINYNSQVKLSHITAPEALQMNGDYALAYAQDEPFYAPYYNELAKDNDWGFRLIKRKKPLQRRLIYEGAEAHAIQTSQEYLNVFEKTDTAFATTTPLVAEFEFSFRAMPVPFDAWLVLQIDGENEHENVFVRTPFNLVKYNWSGVPNYQTALLTGNIPSRIKRIVAYIWNIRKKEINLHIKSFKLLQLEGEGVKEISPAKI